MDVSVGIDIIPCVVSTTNHVHGASVYTIADSKDDQIGVNPSCQLQTMLLCVKKLSQKCQCPNSAVLVDMYKKATTLFGSSKAYSYIEKAVADEGDTILHLRKPNRRSVRSTPTCAVRSNTSF